MEISTPVEEDPVLQRAVDMAAELISARVARWKARQFEMHPALAAELAVRCWDYAFIPPHGPGCLLRNEKGLCVFVPYDDSLDGLSPVVIEQSGRLDRWLGDRKNSPIVGRMDKILEETISKTCFWDFLDGGDASQIDFMGKIKVLARYRIADMGIEVRSVSPLHPTFRLAIGAVTDSGLVKTKQYSLDWNCSIGKIGRCFMSLLKPQYSSQMILAHQIQTLEDIQSPETAAARSRFLSQELRSQKAGENDQGWSYFLLGADDSEEVLTWGDRRWMPLNSHNDLKMMKRLAREGSQRVTIVRRCHTPHYEAGLEIAKLQDSQRIPANSVQKAVISVNGGAIQPPFGGGGASFADHSDSSEPLVLSDNSASPISTRSNTPIVKEEILPSPPMPRDATVVPALKC